MSQIDPEKIAELLKLSHDTGAAIEAVPAQTDQS